MKLGGKNLDCVSITGEIVSNGIYASAAVLYLPNQLTGPTHWCVGLISKNILGKSWLARKCWFCPTTLTSQFSIAPETLNCCRVSVGAVFACVHACVWPLGVFEDCPSLENPKLWLINGAGKGAASVRDFLPVWLPAPVFGIFTWVSLKVMLFSIT